MHNHQIKALLVTIVIQLFFMGLIFISFLLDPLLGMWVIGLYWVVVSSCFIYYLFNAIFKA